MAVADALDRAKYFVLGCSDLIIAVDHKPLLGVLGPRPLDDISNPRLRNIKEKTLRYRFRLVYIPGVRNRVSDCMSRSPSGSTTPRKYHLEDDSTAAILQAASLATPNFNAVEMAGNGHSRRNEGLPQDEALLQDAASASLDGLQSVTWDRVRMATSSDPDLIQLINLLEVENPPESYSDWPRNLCDYYRFRDHLYTIDGVLMYKDRVVIPPSLRQDSLRARHSAHQGVSTMTAKAK